MHSLDLVRDVGLMRLIHHGLLVKLQLKFALHLPLELLYVE